MVREGVPEGGMGREQGERVQPAQQGGEEGEQQRLHGIQARAHGFATRLRGVTEGGGGWGLGFRLK